MCQSLLNTYAGYYLSGALGTASLSLSGRCDSEELFKGGIQGDLHLSDVSVAGNCFHLNLLFSSVSTVSNCRVYSGPNITQIADGANTML